MSVVIQKRPVSWFTISQAGLGAVTREGLTSGAPRLDPRMALPLGR